MARCEVLAGALTETGMETDADVEPEAVAGRVDKMDGSAEPLALAVAALEAEAASDVVAAPLCDAVPVKDADGVGELVALAGALAEAEHEAPGESVVDEAALEL